MMALMKCPKCGKQVSERAKECIHCGCDLSVRICNSSEPSIRCPECNQSIDSHSVQCPNCGFPVANAKCWSVVAESVDPEQQDSAIWAIIDILHVTRTQAQELCEHLPVVMKTSLLQKECIGMIGRLASQGITATMQPNRIMASNIEIVSDRPTEHTTTTQSPLRHRETPQSAPESVNIVKCPTCGSTKVAKISTTSRMVSVGLFGLASGKVGKTMECKNCGYKW